MPWELNPDTSSGWWIKIKEDDNMLTDKLDMLKLEACQAETKAIVAEFKRALLKHFEVVDANATRLINGRWIDNG